MCRITSGISLNALYDAVLISSSLLSCIFKIRCNIDSFKHMLATCVPNLTAAFITFWDVEVRRKVDNYVSGIENRILTSKLNSLKARCNLALSAHALATWISKN